MSESGYLDGPSVYPEAGPVSRLTQGRYLPEKTDAKKFILTNGFSLGRQKREKKITLLHQKAIFHKYRRGREEGESVY